jgi:hypothetical protein
VHAALYDQFGQPYRQETTVTFSTSMGSFWGASTVTVIARTGTAQALLTSSTSAGVATIHARIAGTAAQIDITFGPGPPYSLILTASPARPTVQQASAIEAIVRDEFGNRVKDKTNVQFQTTFGVLQHPEAETRGGVAVTALTSNTPGQATVTAQAGQASGTVIVEFVSLLSLVRVIPDNGCNDAPVTVTIVGAGFAPGALVALDNWTLDASWVDANTLRATIPLDIAAGAYDLTVRNPGGDWALLAQAYTARDCGPLDRPLAGAYLGLSGAEPDFAPRQGDDDQIQVLFLEVPETTPGPLYVRLFDADCGGAHDVQNGKAWDTPFTFTVYGGPGAYTHPDARSLHPTDGVRSGNQLAFVESSQITTDAQWYSLGPLAVSDGELLGDGGHTGKRVFKLTVEGGPDPPFDVGLHFADLNAYNIVLSTSAVDNLPVEGSRILAFSWTFVIPRDRYDTPPRVYPYVGAGTRTIVQHNWDYDRFGENAGVSIVTPERAIQVPYQYVSGDNEQKDSAHDVRETETNTTWALRCWAETVPQLENNLVTMWVTDQNGLALPIFARSTNISPP